MSPEPTPGPPPGTTSRGTAINRVVPASAALGVLVAGLTSHTVLLLVSLMVLTAWAFSRRVTWDIAVGAAFGALLLVACVVGVAGAWIGWRPYASQPVSLGMVMLTAFAAVGATRVTPSDATPHSRFSGWDWMSFIPVLAPLAIAITSLVNLTFAKRHSALIIDTPEHAFLIRRITHDGNLDYSAHAYPRGFHALVGWMTTAAGDPHGLPGDLQTVLAMSWLAYAVMMTLAISLAVRLTTQHGQVVRLLAGLLTGTALVLSDGTLAHFAEMTSPNATMAVVLCLSILLFAVNHTTQLRELLWLLPLATAALAQLWTPMALAGVGVWIAAAALSMRRLRRERSAWIGLVSRTVLALAVAGVITVPLMLNLLSGGGVSLSGLWGVPAMMGGRYQLVVAAGVLWLLLTVRGAASALTLGCVLGLAGAVGVLLLGSGDPTNLAQWYPMKALWFLSVCVLPYGITAFIALTRMTWVAICWLADRTAPYQRLTRLVLAASMVIVVLLANATTLWMLTIRQPRVTNSLADLTVGPEPRRITTSTNSAFDSSERRIEVAQRYSDAFAPAITLPTAIGYDPMSDSAASMITSRMMALTTGQPVTSGSPRRICHEVRQLRDATGKDVVVITALPVEKVRELSADQGCGEVRIEKIPYVSADLDQGLAALTRPK